MNSAVEFDHQLLQTWQISPTSLACLRVMVQAKKIENPEIVISILREEEKECDSNEFISSLDQDQLQSFAKDLIDSAQNWREVPRSELVEWNLEDLPIDLGHLKYLNYEKEASQLRQLSHRMKDKHPLKRVKKLSHIIQPHGIQIEYWDTEKTKKKSEITYRNGEQEGLGRSWYKNGQLEWEGNYHQGKREGVWRSWYQNGQLELEENYHQGEPEGVWRKWYENGQLVWEGNYHQGEREGVWHEWYRNGQLESDRNFHQGQPEGPMRSWYQNGQLQSERNYHQGKREGVWHS